MLPQKRPRTGTTYHPERIPFLHYHAHRFHGPPTCNTPHGSLGALFNRFLSNTTVGQPPSFSTSRPNATAAYDIARSRLVPKGLFQHADRLWQQHNPETAHSGSYKAYTPSANYNQRIGLILSTSISSHLKRCYHKNAHAREQRIIQNVSHSYTTMRTDFTALQHAISDLSPDHLPTPATDQYSIA